MRIFGIILIIVGVVVLAVVAVAPHIAFKSEKSVPVSTSMPVASQVVLPADMPPEVAAAIKNAMVMPANVPMAGGSTRPAAAREGFSLRQQLEIIRQKYNLPALAAAVVTSNGLLDSDAVGVRKTGTNVGVTKNDLWHLGSDTKAMTSVVMAMLVQQGKLKWTTTIGEVFPELTATFPPDYRNTTLVELLSHHAGLPANLDWHKPGTVRELRLQAVKDGAKATFLSKPGTQYAYSNAGYVLAGAMAERVTGKSWEDLITQMVFKPLGMDSAGFGGTGTHGRLDQPWGHDDDGKPVSDNGPGMDNPPVMGPAGRVHCTIQDWAKFIADQLRGENGKPALLPASYYRFMHEPPFGGDYALGWGVGPRPWANGMAYNHAGSNTMNYCIVWMAPKRDFAVLVCTNRSGPVATKACDDVATAVINGYL